MRLIVADEEGKTNEKYILIKAGNAEPEVTLETDDNKSLYWSNTSVHYKLNITDMEDRSLRNGGISPENVKACGNAPMANGILMYFVRVDSVLNLIDSSSQQNICSIFLV